jgi:hypothetical protein
VDCNGVRQHAGSAIDGFLAQEIEQDFQAHLDRCRPCRDEIGLEKLSKQLVRRSVSWIPTPRSIQILIVSSLHQEYHTSELTNDFLIAGVARFRGLVSALAGGAVAAAFAFMVGVPSERSLALSAHTADNDIIRQSFETIAQVRTGRFVPAMISSVPESVGGFFQRSSLQFGVQIPRLRGSDWCGGSASDKEGVRQAHLVYKMGEEWVYLCEMSGEDALNGDQLSLPPAARIALRHSSWYTDPMHPRCSVIVWQRNNVVCVAVSTMEKQQLLALFRPSSTVPQQY